MAMNWMKKTSVLWILFGLVILCVTGFTILKPHVGGVPLDNVASVEKVHTLLSQMSAAQKQTHFIMTLMIDMLFPLAYGFLFAGLALKFLGKSGKWLAIPALATMFVDVCENVIQLMALKGNEILLPVKAGLTPLKNILFAVAVFIALCAIISGIVRAIRNRRTVRSV